ncbi:MAG: sulfite exporter TauE/SafE family protein [Eggerthellaceae bacterium]|nr:sulfite exporter TauE/SafE family protein [Eggerthellaceae bacterium]
MRKRRRVDSGLIIALLSGLAVGFVLSFAVGLAIGFFSGLLGIGGGTLMVPAFKLGFAMDAIAATATSLFTIIPTSLAGFAAHLRRGTCIPKIGVAAGLAGAVTSPLGVWLASRSQDWMIMAVAALVIGYSAFTMLRKGLAMPRGKAAEGSGEPRRSVSASESDPEPASLPAAPTVTARMLSQAGLIGMMAGLASGYVGVGGGFLMVPLFMNVLKTPMKLTSGTSLIAVMILAVPGVVYQAWLGNIDWLAGIAVALGSVPGAALGARLVPRVPERALRLTFGCFLLFAAAMLLVDQLAPLR